MVCADEENVLSVLTYNRTKSEVLTLSTFCKKAVTSVVINILILDFNRISDIDYFNMLKNFRAYLLNLRILY